MAKFRLDLDRAGVRAAALTSPDVRAALRKVGELTAEAARTRDAAVGVTSAQSEFVVIDGGESRARVYVRAEGPQAAARESKYRILGGALPGGGV